MLIEILNQATDLDRIQSLRLVLPSFQSQKIIVIMMLQSQFHSHNKSLLPVPGSI